MTTKRLTAEDLAVIEARASTATGGEWVAYEPTEFRGDIRIAKARDEYPDGRPKNTYIGRLVESHVGHEKPRREDGAFIAAARTDVPDLIAEVRALTAERDELRAIIAGRKVAPTLAEIAKHSGEWLCDGEAVSLYFSDDHDTKLRVRAASMTASIGDTAARVWLLMKNAEGARWIALDDGRPCAWPKVTP